MSDDPIWFRIAFICFFVLGLITLVYTVNECGVKAFFLGNGAPFAAVSGMCE